MATRYYLPISGVAGADPALSSGFADDEGIFGSSLPMATAKSNTTLTAEAEPNPSVVGTHRWAQYVSPQIGVIDFTGTTFSMVIKTLVGISTVVGKIRATLRLLHVNNTLTSLLAAADYDTAIPTTAATRIINATALLSVISQNNDRLILEIGADITAVDGTHKATLTLGDPSATADYALTSGLTTSLDPWVEFSANIPAASPYNAKGQFFEFFH